MKKNAPTSASKVINLGRISLTFLLTNKDRISYLNAQWTQGLKWRENSKRVEYFVLYCTRLRVRALARARARALARLNHVYCIVTEVGRTSSGALSAED